MLTTLVNRTILFCVAYSRVVVAASLVLATLAAVYAATHFAINSDINALLSKDLDWRRREVAFENAFGRYQVMTVVVTAPTSELATAATAALTDALNLDKVHFREVSSSGTASFFLQHGLLFQSPQELAASADGLIKAEPLIRDLSTDRSMRGVVAALEDSLIGVQSSQLSLDDLTRVMSAASDTVEGTLTGKPAHFSWRALVSGKPSVAAEKRGFVEVRPVLDYSALEPGRRAGDAVRQIAAATLPKFQATARLTGPVAMSDEQFATIKENALRNGIITVAVVVLILWLALGSFRLIAAVVVTLGVGLALTAALGLLMVGSLNVISVYFAVLFVGIGVDFAIQYSVRYRADRHDVGNLRGAIITAGSHVAAPLTLAAFATAAGFLSFLPTNYRGVSELGLIAGAGMLIAFATSITLLPALLTSLKPPTEQVALGYTSLAPLDNFLARHRIGIIVGTGMFVAAGLPLLYWLRFDFNPINLQNPHSEATATYLELARDKDSNTNAVEVLAPSLQEADAIAARVSKLPDVARAMTLATFVPAEQSEKLPILQRANDALAEAFDAKNAEQPPSDAENVEALKRAADRLNDTAGELKGVGAEAARRLSRNLSALATADVGVRTAVETTFVQPLQIALAMLQTMLKPDPITMQSLPPDLVREWSTASGQARVSIVPSADPGDNDAIRRFARAVLKVEPTATEGPIAVLEAGNTIVRAFVQAGIWALLSIALLLWLVLRRFSDVLLTLIPLILAGVVTLELCVVFGLPLNFANIIAIPLLLGVGVAFKIYYIMAWREGQTHLLQTSLTRAVVYSALTTATAFGSLWFSDHPGTSSMGKLLALSLVSTLAAAVLFQPILMGAPRTKRGGVPAVGQKTQKETMP